MQRSAASRFPCAIMLFVLACAAGNASSVVDLTQKPIDPLRDSPGKLIVLIFVRTDCPLSNRYAPAIQEMAHKYAANAQFWLVYPGRSQTAAAIAKQKSDYGYTLPVARDLTGELVRLSDAKTTPEAAVFDRSRKLIYHGRIDNWYEDFGRARATATTHELDDAIRAGLEGKSPAVITAPAIGCSIADLQ